MSFARLFPRPRSFGVALEDNRVTAALPSTGRGTADRLWTRSLTPAPQSQPWSDLTDALRELREQVGGHGGTLLFVALMPPLGRVRLIKLAGVSEEEAARVVRRDPSRFFPVRGERLTVELQGSGWRRSPPFIVAAAPHTIVEQVAASAAASGWSLGGIAPAQLAWAALVREAAPRDLVVRCAHHLELLRVARGALIGARRLPLRDVPPVTDEALPPIDSESEAAARAAALAGRWVGPVLSSELERAVARRTRRRGAIVRAAMAAALFVGAAMLELFGVERERGRIAAERRRIHAEVARSMAVRESIAVASERLAALRGAGARPARWSELITTLAEELPEDVHLVSLTAEGDSVHLEGVALRAAPVFDAVNAISSVRGVRADGPIRQELHGTSASEHFLLSAFVRNAAAPPHIDVGPTERAAGGRP